MKTDPVKRIGSRDRLKRIVFGGRGNWQLVCLVCIVWVSNPFMAHGQVPTPTSPFELSTLRATTPNPAAGGVRSIVSKKQALRLDDSLTVIEIPTPSPAIQPDTTAGDVTRLKPATELERTTQVSREPQAGLETIYVGGESSQPITPAPVSAAPPDSSPVVPFTDSPSAPATETIWEPEEMITSEYPAVVSGSVCDDFAVWTPSCESDACGNTVGSCGGGQCSGSLVGQSCSCMQTCNSRVHVPLCIGTRANGCRDGSCWLSEYQQRAMESCPSNPTATVDNTVQYSTWWDELMQQAAGLAQTPAQIHVDALIQSALTHSPHVQVAATLPHIKRTFIAEEDAAFDWTAFLENRFDDLNDPIGNTLTTGNNDDRFKQREWYNESGLRRRNREGGQFEITQRYGLLRNNSRFLVPPNQGNSRLELNYTQPLLNGRGRFVNQSLTMLAQIDYGSASDEFVVQLQDHLLLVTEAYWELYRARANYFQRKRLLESAEAILANLSGRADVDALDRQVLRAKAAVANRKSEIARAMTSIRNAESQLRLLVNDPSMLNSSCMEFLPGDVPMTGSMEMPINEAIRTALTYRPDISQAIRDLRASTVRIGVARNDLLPQLDMFIGTYVAGLNGNSDVFNAVVNQFSDGRPGYNFGLQFEMPLGMRAANARHSRRKWEYTRAISKFRAVAETAMTEVELAIREVSTTHQEMAARFEAMGASSNETEYLVDRWQTLPNVDDSATLLLEDLLDSQSRLADEEAAFVQAQVNYAVSLVKVRQVLGTLMQVHPAYAE